jgi:hypothetical protein
MLVPIIESIGFIKLIAGWHSRILQLFIDIVITKIGVDGVLMTIIEFIKLIKTIVDG